MHIPPSTGTARMGIRKKHKETDIDEFDDAKTLPAADPLVPRASHRSALTHGRPTLRMRRTPLPPILNPTSIELGGSGLGRISEWRANDVVVYDGMREEATLLTGLLARRAEAAPDQQSARDEIAQWRREVLDVDGYDRDGVRALQSRIRDRLAEFAGAGS